MYQYLSVVKGLDLVFTNFGILMECETIQLSNGLRVAFMQDLSIHTIHCGFIINAGSRDEHENEHGLAHLIEHCLFKGTKSRKPYHILSRLDSVGGELNAYTTKEETCIYASAMKNHFNRATELLCDIVFHSQFPTKEVSKELKVIHDEINSYRESPDEMLLDEFEERLFPNNTIGRNILGSPESISKFKQNALQDFVSRLYTNDQIVFACVGNISRSKFDRFCATYLEQIPMTKRVNGERTLPISEHFEIYKEEHVHQNHTVLGGQAMGMKDTRVNTMLLLNNALGGPALNSLLNLNIREKLGYCYYIESNYNPYTDIGIFQIYFGTDSKYFKRTLKLVWKELNRLKEKKVSDRFLSGAKKQLIGQIALAREHRSSLMIAHAKSLLYYNEVETFNVIQDKINEISAQNIQDVSIDVFDERNLSLLSYMPTN